MKNYYYLPVSFPLPISAVSGEIGFTQEAATKSKVIDEVVVTEIRIEESKQLVTANHSVISSETIEQTPRRDLGELLTEYGLARIQKYPGFLFPGLVKGSKHSLQK